MTLKWQGVTVTIGGHRVVNDCSGSAVAGTVTAIMGPSGSGKTTLLNVLSRRSDAFDGTGAAPPPFTASCALSSLLVACNLQLIPLAALAYHLQHIAL